MMKNLEISPRCVTQLGEKRLCQEIKCGLLDFSKINIPDLIQPNKLKQYSWKPSCYKSQQTFGIPFLKSDPKLIALPFEYLQRN